MIDVTRHADYLKEVNLHKTVHVVGCGSIGTIAATTLARVGFHDFVLWDDDKVAEHNIANQYFEHSDLDKEKVSCLAEKIRSINTEASISTEGRFEVNSNITDGCIVVVGVDSMLARKNVFDVLKGKRIILVDGRMGGENGQVHALKLDNNKAVTEYEKTLYSDEEASELPCTARTIIYTVSVTANIMVKLLLTLLTTKTAYKVIIVDMKSIQLIEVQNMTDK